MPTRFSIYLASQGSETATGCLYDFKSEKLEREVLDDLHYQFIRRLEKEADYVKRALIDGTKLEANAYRYTFVWRGSMNYHLATLLDTIDVLYSRYNALLTENSYDQKYELGNARMFIVEGMAKVRETIEKNRKRKKYSHRKIK